MDTNVDELIRMTPSERFLVGDWAGPSEGLAETAKLLAMPDCYADAKGWSALRHAGPLRRTAAPTPCRTATPTPCRTGPPPSCSALRVVHEAIFRVTPQ